MKYRTVNRAVGVFCLGDLVTPLRPWPTPDPAKCSALDRVAVAVKQEFIIRFYPLETRWAPLFSEGHFPEDQLEPLGTDGGLWVPKLLAPGWFWASEPRPLVWEDFEEPETPGVPCWRATTAAGDFKMAEYVLGVTEHSMRAQWEIRGPHSYNGTFHDFNKAKRGAARIARDLCTRRTT